VEPLPALSDFSRGLSVVPDDEVIEMYEGSHVPLEQMSDFYGKVMRRSFSIETARILLLSSQFQLCDKESGETTDMRKD
jgi:hypothetical protein